MIKVRNEYGTGNEIDFNAAMNIMDGTLREIVYNNGYEEPQAFFNAYCILHKVVFLEEFEPNKKNGNW